VLVKKSALALAGTYVAGLALSLAGPSFIPDYYYFDAQTIRELMAAPAPLTLGDSFNNTALAYRLLGFGGLLPDWLAQPLSFTLAWIALVAASGLGRAAWRPWLFALVAAWTVPLAIYDGTYSKETIALLVVAAMARLSVSPRGVMAATALGLAYALLFRTYWGVVLVLWLTMLATWRMGGGWSVRLLAAALMIVPLSLAAHAYAGLWLTDGRTVVMEARELIADAATMFANPLENTSPMTDIVNAAAGWATLVLPAYLLFLGRPQHVAFALFQFANTLVFVAALVREKRAPRGGASFNWRFASAATFCVAYSMVQGMFEPDFGSFAKHETTLLPVLFYVLVTQGARRGRSGRAEVPLFARERG
jgi:hypothetical protein